MTTEILLHDIEYTWKDGQERELADTDSEQIEEMIKAGYREGELCQWDHELDSCVYGWWSIGQ